MEIHSAFAEIDLRALCHNLQEVRRFIPSDCGILAVVKADAYGHGFKNIAIELDKLGVTAFGVANLAEGIQLRKSGINRPILIFGGIYPGQEHDCIMFSLSTVVFSEEQAQVLNRVAGEMSQMAKVHLKVDTGMGRLGIPYEETRHYLRLLKGLKHIDFEGILSHFTSADELNDDGQNYTARQLELFSDVVIQAKEEGISPRYVHIANSAASLNSNLPFCNMVRTGIVLYGSAPSASFAGKLDLWPVMRLKSRVAMLKWVETGTSISYARRFVALKKTLIASVPVGYADGYRRDLTNRGEAIIRGKRARVVGTVCMDWLMLDVTHIEGVTEGDEVVLLGCDATNNCIQAQELADWAGTIPYEILCGISKRVPRVYI